MKNVFIAESPAEAHLVAGLLEEEGIVCVIEGEMVLGEHGDFGLGASSLPHVSVADEDAERALAVIASRRKAAEETPDEPPTS